jgi:hypothetical protein
MGVSGCLNEVETKILYWCQLVIRMDIRAVELHLKSRIFSEVAFLNGREY